MFAFIFLRFQFVLLVHETWCVRCPLMKQFMILCSMSSQSDTVKKTTIHQVTTLLATSKNVLFSGHNHLLTTSTDDPSFACARAIIKVWGHQYRWLAGGLTWKYELLEVASYTACWLLVG